MDLNEIRRMAGVAEIFAGDKSTYSTKPQINEAAEVSLSDNMHELTGNKASMFILVHDPLSDQSTPADIIAVVDGPSFANVFIGASSGTNDAKVVAKENWTLYHYSRKAQAIADANKRLKSAGIDSIVTEGLMATKTAYGEDLNKLAKVIQSVKNPEQLASAEKYADLMFKKIKKGVRNTDTFGSGLERLSGILDALKSDLAQKKKELSAVNEEYKNSYSVGDKVNTPFGPGVITKDLGQEKDDHFFIVKDSEGHHKIGSMLFKGHITEDCGQSHSENGEVATGVEMGIQCPICADGMPKEDFYQHMMTQHENQMCGQNDKVEDEEVSYEDEEAMNYKSSMNKGQHVEYEGRPHIVVVPDAQGDFVGIAPVGQEDDPDAVKLVHARELMKDEDEEQIVIDVRMEELVNEVSTVNGKEQTGPKLKQTTAASESEFVTKLEKAFGKVKKVKKTATMSGKKVVYYSFISNGKEVARISPKRLVNGKDMFEILSEAVDATVWDKAMTDKDESPESPKSDDVKVTVPPKVKSALKKEIKELQTAAKKVEVSDADRAEFYDNCAAAMQQLIVCLDYGTMTGIKKAQIHMTSLMSPIVQRIPDIAYDFITGGGEPTTLKTLFKKVKEKK